MRDMQTTILLFITDYHDLLQASYKYWQLWW